MGGINGRADALAILEREQAKQTCHCGIDAVRMNAGFYYAASTGDTEQGGGGSSVRRLDTPTSAELGPDARRTPATNIAAPPGADRHGHGGHSRQPAQYVPISAHTPDSELRTA